MHSEPFVSGAPHCGKVLLCITEDWFLLSHFRPLLATLSEIASEVVVATRSSGRFGEIEQMGARVVPFDFRRSSLNPVEQFGTVRRLARLIREEQPDVLHVIAMQPMVLAALAQRGARTKRTVFHLTGLGFVGISRSGAARLIRPAALWSLGGVLARPNSWLLCENADDLAFLVEGGADPAERVTILGGAGLDPDEFPPLPSPDSAPPVAAFVGRMIRSKGLDVLVDAGRRLADRGRQIHIDLYGKSDADNPEAIPVSQLETWSREGFVAWRGHTSDVKSVWARSDIAVLPAITREGMPRSVLEAASSARPLIVTDVPGCRHFVRDGIEGFVVPAGDAAALATALEKLARDPELRHRMGLAARARLLEAFTISHVQDGIRDSYARLLAGTPAG